MRKISSFFVITGMLMLSGCGGGETLQYTATFGALKSDAPKRAQLVESLERVLTGKLGALEITDAQVLVTPEDDEAKVVISKLTPEQVPQVEDIIKRPFSIDLRLEKTGPKGEDYKQYDPVNWDTTSISTMDIGWVNLIQERETGQAGVELVFTESGRAKLTDLFRKNPNRNVGVFVRDRLVSSLAVNGSDIKERIIIGGIPSLETARIFSDDVNTGLHITLTP